MKKTVRDIDVAGRKVLVRCDFNVPMKDGNITNDIRIVSALPTIKYLIENDAAVILMSHMGRPKGEPKPEFTLRPVADRLSELLGQDVIFGTVAGGCGRWRERDCGSIAGRTGDAPGKCQIQSRRNEERGTIHR